MHILSEFDEFITEDSKYITLILQFLFTVDVPDPILNAISLHASEESMYTKNIF